jgi:hypothetical protein
MSPQWKEPCFDGWEDEGIICCYHNDPTCNPDDCLHLKKGLRWEDCTSGGKHRAYESYQQGKLSNDPLEKEPQ